MSMLVQRLFIAVHEVPKNVSMLNMDHHQHLVLCVVCANECETIRPVAVGDSPNFQWTSRRIHSKSGETLSSIWAFQISLFIFMGRKKAPNQSGLSHFGLVSGLNHASDHQKMLIG
jgi:hypothetical protein